MSRDWQLRIDDVLEACDRIEAYLEGYDYDRFEQDNKTIDAVIRQFEVMGEAVKALPEEIRNREPEIQWRQIAGFRDVLSHAYFAVNHLTIWDATQTKLPELRAACGRLKNTSE
jgi:uncharacterized protein with HEPN domain